VPEQEVAEQSVLEVRETISLSGLPFLINVRIGMADIIPLF
jgi:hypothetical protein